MVLSLVDLDFFVLLRKCTAAPWFGVFSTLLLITHTNNKTTKRINKKKKQKKKKKKRLKKHALYTHARVHTNTRAVSNNMVYLAHHTLTDYLTEEVL